ncbi:MAG: hypothetical protein AB7I79_14175 [Rhizobiaceae bacterium]
MHETAPTNHARTLWSPASADWSVVRPQWTARPVRGLGQTLVSGDIGSAVAALAPGSPEAGLWSVVPASGSVVRTGRDRAVLVSSMPMDIVSGWRDGFAATPADALYAVIELAGDGVRQLVSQGAGVDLDAGSQSAALLFAGVHAFLYRTAETVARLHVDAPYETYLRDWLDGADG